MTVSASARTAPPPPHVPLQKTIGAAKAGSRPFKGQVVSRLDVCKIPNLHSQSCEPDINLTLLSAGEPRLIAATSASEIKLAESRSARQGAPC
jgi:hypothetical protein